MAQNTNTGDREPPISTLYVPATPQGKLDRRLQGAENRYSELYKTGWVKIIERGGNKLKDIVGNKYP